jgi:hypothetical protein
MVIEKGAHGVRSRRPRPQGGLSGAPSGAAGTRGCRIRSWHGAGAAPPRWRCPWRFPPNLFRGECASPLFRGGKPATTGICTWYFPPNSFFSPNRMSPASLPRLLRRRTTASAAATRHQRGPCRAASKLPPCPEDAAALLVARTLLYHVTALPTQLPSGASVLLLQGGQIFDSEI